MKDCKLAFILLLLIGSLSTFSQEKDSLPSTINLPTKRLKKAGLEVMEKGDPYSAIDFFNRYLEVKIDDHKIAYKLAECYKEARDYTNAAEWYEKAYEMHPGRNTLGLFYVAQMQKSQGRYEESMKTMEEFLEFYKGMKDESKYKKLAQLSIDGSSNAQAILDSGANVKLTHLDKSINKAHTEFSPIYFDDSTMLYGAIKLDSVIYFNMRDSNTVLPKRKFYLAEKTKTNWKHLEAFDAMINDDEMEMANGTFSPDRTSFYFSKCGIDWRGKLICQIYKSVIDSFGDWQEPVLLPPQVNNPLYSNSQIAVGTESKKGYEVIYFVSERPDSKGGKDIYYSVFDGKKQAYKEAKNAGNKINTTGDEATPFFDFKTRQLYFSSDGWPTIGGLDIFRSSGELKKWSPPINIGSPFNSPADDLYFAWHPNHEEGFVVSNREGGVALKNPTCCDDLYEFEYYEYIHFVIDGTVLNNDSTEAIVDAIATLFRVDSTVQQEMMVESKKVGVEGQFEFKLEMGFDYKILISAKEFFSKSIDVSTIDMTVVDSSTVTINLDTIPNIGIELENVYFVYNTAILTDSSLPIIDSVLVPKLKDNRHLQIEISTHTDSRGSDKYNERLSRKRAKAIVQYLMAKGIEEQCLTSEGYGEKFPVAPNDHPDGTDNPEGRQKNRRAEFKVLGECKRTYSDDDF